MTKKLVINSHILYKKPLKLCLESLLDIGFKGFENVIIIQNGCNQNSEPTFKSFFNKKVIFTETTQNNLDCTGFQILYEYRSHPLIQSSEYWYVPDTCTFDKSFIEKFESSKLSKEEIKICRNPHSFICVFSSDLISLYQNNFSSYQLNKEEIIKLEVHDIIENVPLKSITQFGNRIFGENRIQLKSHDIYKRDHFRACFYYPDFGIYKWMNGHFDGVYRNIPPDLLT